MLDVVEQEISINKPYYKGYCFPTLTETLSKPKLAKKYKRIAKHLVKQIKAKNTKIIMKYEINEPNTNRRMSDVISFVVKTFEETIIEQGIVANSNAQNLYIAECNVNYNEVPSIKVSILYSNDKLEKEVNNE